MINGRLVAMIGHIDELGNGGVSSDHDLLSLFFFFLCQYCIVSGG